MIADTDLREDAMGQVEGKVAIVTGGASGIGAACAATLAREGAKVVVTDLDDSRGETLVAEIGSAGGEAVFLHQDVSLEESWPGIIEATERRFGRLDVMVANAGIGIMCKAVEMSLADWRCGASAVAPSSSRHPLPVSGDQRV
jgi:NAD(P)-dependent dehydrogenase (short-subunit alcohol dehydrogenase family)